MVKNPEVYLFVEKNNNECLKAEELLRSLNIPFILIDVDKNGVRGWMLKDFGTMEVPLLATQNAVVIGLKNIENFVKNNIIKPL
ncbi:MAG: hypothetical protein J7L38_01245 [Thermoproteales archaeon]|nr:hypothetical protein [Thermoproteales archaeon]RLE65700.1 MAG: hypothetical protein DRJ47_04475 [Thermoprotei archaeon]